MRKTKSFTVLVLFVVLAGGLWWYQKFDFNSQPHRVQVAEPSGEVLEPSSSSPPRSANETRAKRSAAAEPDAIAAAAEQERLDRLLFPRLEDSEWAIEGRVIDEKGVLLPGARISATPLDRSVEGSTFGESDAQGFYRVGVPQDGLYRVKAEVFPKSSQSHDVRAGSTGVDFVLGLRGAIEGRVLDGRTREPVTSFQIGFLRGQIPDPNTTGGFQFRGQGDREGRFRLENVEAGDVSVFVRASGFVNASVVVNDVPSGGTTRGLEVLLGQAHGVSGLVVDGAGAPVANAEVVVYELYDGRGVLQHNSPKTRSDESGNFTVGGLAVGNYAVNAYREGYASGEETVAIPSAEPVTVVLPEGGTVEGRVTVGGFSAPGVRISINSDATGRSLSAETDEDGHYRAVGATPGAVRVHAKIGRELDSRSRSVEAQVVAGETALADIEFPSADGSLEGKIYGANMEPAEVAITMEVDAAGHAEYFRMSHALGEYEFKALPSGTAALEVYKDRNLLKRIAVEIVAGESLVQDIHLDTGFGILCTFSVAGGFEEIRVMAIPGEIAAAMSLDNLIELQSASIANAKSAAGEPVVLGGLEAGTYTILAWAQPEGYHFATPDTRPQLIAIAATAAAIVTLGEGNEWEEVELALR